MQQIQAGVPVLSFGNIPYPANGTAGIRYALPRKPIYITWRQVSDVAPTAISVSIRTSLNDITAEMAILDTSTTVAGEMRTVGPLVANFVEAYLTSVTAGSGTKLTVEIEVA